MGWVEGAATPDGYGAGALAWTGELLEAGTAGADEPWAGELPEAGTAGAETAGAEAAAAEEAGTALADTVTVE